MTRSGRPLLLALVLAGCEVSGDPAQTGGSGGQIPSSGGANAAGGLTAAGGDLSGGGGATSNESGGAPATGGASSGGSGAGGTPAAGGEAAAGGSGVGGTTGDPTCDAGVLTGETPGPLTLSGNTFAHDPTMIRIGSTYYRFWTGDYIPMATSTNLTDWSNAPSVYGGSYPDWVDPWLAGVPGETFNFPWAPDVSTFEGLVHIYSTFSAKFGDNISCISHLSTPNLETTAFSDHGPVICTEGNESHNAIDADVELDDEGTPWLAFGSFWDGIMLSELDESGTPVSDELVNLAWANEIEAPVLFRRCGYYYLFVSHGLCCPGEGRSVDDLSYRVLVGRAESIVGPYIDRDGAALLDGGGTLIVQGDGTTWAAAGHSDVLLDGSSIYHLYHAYRQSSGAAELRIARLEFDEEGWPLPHAP